MAVFVKILLIEPRLNFVSMATGTRNSRSASPYAFSRNAALFLARRTTPENSSREARSRRNSSAAAAASASEAFGASAAAFGSPACGSTLSTLIPVSRCGGSGSASKRNWKAPPASAFIRSAIAVGVDSSTAVTAIVFISSRMRR